MKIYEVTWFKEFSCLCGACSQSCCRGWVIPLSDSDCDRFRKEKGILGIELFLATGGWTDAKFNKGSGSCPFHNREGLCRLQRKKGHDYIPWTCQSYPRFYRNYGEFEERCLDLSCIGAAGLFIKNKGNLETVISEDDPQTRLCTTNDDREYLDFLIRQRSEMIDITKSVFSEDHNRENITRTRECGCLADILFSYAAHLQDHFAKGEDVSIQQLSFCEYYDEMIRDDPNKIYAFPLPPEVLGRFLDSSLNHTRLRRVSPYLFRMFIKANNILGKYGKSRALWDKKVNSFLNVHPQVLSLLGSYLSYYLYQYYLRTYETYSFRRQVALGLIHMNMILFLAIAKEEESRISEETMAEVIAVYNRRAYFNDDIQDEMYRIFESGR